jgi:predicted methyltransferase
VAIFTAENAPVWQAIFDDVSKDKPAVGRLVRITRGVNTGRIGRVRRHMVSRFKNPFRYGNEASHAMTQARGRSGFVVLVECEGLTFWADAALTMVCLED